MTFRLLLELKYFQFIIYSMYSYKLLNFRTLQGFSFFGLRVTSELLKWNAVLTWTHEATGTGCPGISVLYENSELNFSFERYENVTSVMAHKKKSRVYVKIIIITSYKTRFANNYIFQTRNQGIFSKDASVCIVMVFIFYLLRGSLTQISVDGRRRTYLFENFEDLIEYRKRLERIKQFY